MILLFLAILFGLIWYLAEKEHARYLKIEKRKEAWSALERALIVEIGRFKGDAGIVVKDLDTGLEFEFNKDKLFPSASLAKIPIMAACFDADRKGRLKLDDTVRLKGADKMNGSGLLKDMRPGVEFTIEELAGRMIYDSDNTATNILTEKLGIDYLNSEFRKFGLRNTTLSRKVADYRARRAGLENYTTAGDMALLLEKIYRRTLINKNISEECLKLLRLQRIGDRIPKYLPADAVVAHKTGLENGVCHDAGIIFTDRGNFLISVLTKHADQNSKRAKKFIAKIAFLAYSH